MPFMKDISVQRSENILKDFIQVSTMNYDIKKTFIKYYERVSLLQQAWIKNRSNFEFRATVLKRMWDKEADVMILY